MALAKEERELVRQSLSLGIGALLAIGLANLVKSNLGQNILGNRRDELFCDNISQRPFLDGIDYVGASILEGMSDEKEALTENLDKEKEKNKKLREENKKIKNSVRDIEDENRQMRKRLAILDERRGGPM